MPEKLSGGGSNQWLIELTPEGNIPTEDGVELRGGHKGFFTALNVANPQPGFEYEWPLNTARDVQLARMKGWRQVQDDDPEMAAFRMSVLGDHDDSDQPTPLDTSNVFQDVILMRMPSEQLAKIRADQEKERKAVLEGGATASFLRGARSDEIMAGHGRQTRFARGDHSVERMEGDNVVDQWIPGPSSQPKGIISEE